MSRADAYGAYYRDSRARLLHQVYAYCGNTEVAQRALADAFVSAGHHWRKLVDIPDKDSWMREHAWRATGRAQNRARKPWYESAMSTADEHRALLAAMTALPPPDRKLMILRYIVGLDLSAAGREIGVTDSAARASIETSLASFGAAGIDTHPRALVDALDHLHGDLHDEPVDNANRLRREGNRRRRSHMVLVGVTSLALAIGAGAITAAHSPAETTGDGSSSDIVGARPTPPPPEEFTADDLAPVSSVRGLDGSRPWKVTLTSSDFGSDEPVAACLPSGPSERRADHYWVRQFSSGRGDSPTQATESLEVAPTPEDAKTTYARLVDAVAACRAASRQIVDYRTVTGIGDDASMYTLRYVVGDSVREETITLVRSGNVVTTWVVRPGPSHPIRSRLVLRLAGDTANTLCSEADGGCSMRPYLAELKTPPPSIGPPGYLAAVDLPVFSGMPQPWVATAPKPLDKNPSATECDQADFDAGGGRRVTSRIYVIPDAPKLAAIFGMTETVGEFRSNKAARSFVDEAAQRVDRCEDRQPNATVQDSAEVDSGRAHGAVWQISVAPSENQNLSFRVGLVRVGSHVAEVTFTPTEEVDVDDAEYRDLVERAAQRLTQL
jgi:DNA-directed RNA polymerase specialized sigma24 family protein